MRGVVVAVAVAALGQGALAQDKPTVDVYIREQAGLPPSSARGEIQLVEIGARALDAKLSIVGHRTAEGWRVSYVCAQSQACDPKRFILAKDFALSAEAAKGVDAVLARLRDVSAEDSGAPPRTGCGRLAVAIDDRGFKRDYRRACTPGADLDELKKLLKAGLP